MDREDDVFNAEARLETIRKLSQTTIELLVPEQGQEFATSFATWAALPHQFLVREELHSKALSPYLDLSQPPSGPSPGLGFTGLTPERGLDTTLVAGMFFQVLLEAERLPINSVERSRFVKREVKNFLVQRLAGQITLSQFFRLMHLIENEITHYFDRIRGEWLSTAPEATPEPPLAVTSLPRPQPEPVQQEKLRRALEQIPSLPRQANRKLSTEGLLKFLTDTRGQWFRLLDFEYQFSMNKKTAWTYLSLLLNHGILRHNEQKANRVRYALAPRFLTAAPGDAG